MSETYLATHFHDNDNARVFILGVFSTLDLGKKACEASHGDVLVWEDKDPVSKAADNFFQFRVYRMTLDAIPPKGWHRVG